MKIKKPNDKKEKIIELLKSKGELATTKISFLITANLYQTETYLEELLNEGIVEKDQVNNFTSFCA